MTTRRRRPGKERVRNTPVHDAKYVIDMDTQFERCGTRRYLRDKMTAGAIDGYIWLSDDAIAQRKVIYSGRKATDFMDKSRLSRALTRAIAEQQLAARGVTQRTGR